MAHVPKPAPLPVAWQTRMTSLSHAVERVTLRPAGLAAAILLVLLASVWGRMVHEDHAFDNTYVHQAVAFARGHVTIETKIFDTAERGGRLFVIFPPGPALLLAPFAALWGTHLRVLLVTPVLGALIAFLAFRLARRIGVTSQTARWAVIGLVFGTSLLLSMRIPIDTYLSHCCAVAALFVALDEAFGRQRGLIIGFALGFAVLSRQPTALTIPFVWAVLLLRPQAGTGRALRSIAATWVGLLVCAGFYLWLNDARFGNPLDFGYEYLRESTWYGYRAERWGQFNWVYVPSNLIRMLLNGFAIEFDAPSYMVPHMSPWGTSLTFASPWVFFALRGRLAPIGLQRAAWVSICVTTLAVLAHKSAMGGWQINGLRYTLDFMPVLFVLAALGMQRFEGTPYQRLAHALIVYSVVLNFVAQDGVDYLGQWLQHLPH